VFRVSAVLAVQYKDTPPPLKLQGRMKKQMIFKGGYAILTLLSAISFEVVAIIAVFPDGYMNKNG